jgi:calcineurin-like phosphoesterase
MRILFVADLVGKPGRRVARALLPQLRAEKAADVVVANGENLAAGFGVTGPTVSDLLDMGVDVVTSGNHIWDRREGLTLLESEPRLLRPANYPPGNPGSGAHVVDELRADTNIIVIDFHAEATAEKQAFARYMDGLVSAIVGTHTHVPTADARVLPGGTAYVTDLGMTGSHRGVIGYRAEQAIQRAALGRRIRLEPAEGELRLQGAMVDVDPASGHAKGIERIDLVYEEE